MLSPLYPAPRLQVHNGSWFAPAGEVAPSPFFFRARRRIRLCPGQKLRVHIAAESIYLLWVNGRFVERGPVRGTATVSFYDSFEIPLDWLRLDGDNWLAVLVGCQNIPTFKYAAQQPALWVECEGIDELSPGWEVESCRDWRQDVPLFTFQTGFQEWRDYRVECIGWQTGAESAGWEAPVPVSPALPGAEKRLLARDIPGLWRRRVAVVGEKPHLAARVPALQDRDATDIARRMSEEEHFPLPATDFRIPFTLLPPDGKQGVALLFDFGQEVVGGFELEVEGRAGTVLDIGYEEAMTGQRLSVLASQDDGTPRYEFADRFVLREGRQTVSNFWERGYRYLQIVLRDMSEPIVFHRLAGRDIRYPVPRLRTPGLPSEEGTFCCSDPALNRLWEVCRETLSACATDTLTDCPWREAAFWVNDLLVENVTWLQAFGDGRLNARSLRLAFSQQRADGLIPGVCPTDGQDSHVLFATNLFLPTILEEYQLYSGDSVLIHKLFPSLHRIFETLLNWTDHDGLLTPPDRFWNFVDWSYPFADWPSFQGRNTAVVNAFYLLGLEAMSRLCPEKQTVYHSRAKQVFHGLEKRFLDKARGLYHEFSPGISQGEHTSELTQALMLASHLIPSDRRASLAKGLVASEHEKLLRPELYLHLPVLRALTAAGRSDLALARIRQYWLPMLEAGAHTIWEAGVHQFGKPAFAGAGSLCHGFATAPIDFLQTVILGVRPLKPGFAEYEVRPEPLLLDWATGTVPTPLGPISVTWKREGNETILLDSRGPRHQ